VAIGTLADGLKALGSVFNVTICDYKTNELEDWEQVHAGSAV
jgi:hypothetical protein